jgi:uncharacterized membrane protein YgdD (TMEM256/DUF423 family)
MSVKFIFWGIILAGLAVIFGAFGTHLIAPYFADLPPEPKVTPPMEVFETGVRYQFYHAMALIVTGLLYRQKSTRQVKNAGILFLLGVIMFSGSLYFITLGHLVHRDFKFVWPITPLGGLSFIIAWGLLAMTFRKK